MACHPHDSICGCSIDAVHDEMRPRFDQVEQMGEEITRQSLNRLVEVMDTSAPASTGARLFRDCGLQPGGWPAQRHGRTAD